MPLTIKRHNRRSSKTPIRLKILQRRLTHNFVFKGLSSKDVQIFITIPITRITIKTKDLKAKGRNETSAHDDVAERFHHGGPSRVGSLIHHSQ
jgi:hypothetical protein